MDRQLEFGIALIDLGRHSHPTDVSRPMSDYLKMFSTLDSQPEEWLYNDQKKLHTLSFCCFRDSASARNWIHRLVPKNQTGHFLKWSNGGGQIRTRKRRIQFIEEVIRNYEDMDFSVHCISSTEGEISNIAQAFYVQNLSKIRQELDEKGRNCLVFKITDTKEIKIPVLRAGMLIWIFYVIKYMKDENRLNGFIYSDWFSTDTTTGEDKALGVSMVNFLLKSTRVDLQLSIPNDPGSAEADLLSDWFAGWCNSSKTSNVDVEINAGFEKVIGLDGNKIDWVEFATDFT